MANDGINVRLQVKTVTGGVGTIYGSPESNYLQQSGPDLSHHHFFKSLQLLKLFSPDRVSSKYEFLVGGLLESVQLLVYAY